MNTEQKHNWLKRLVIIQAFCLFSWFGFSQDTLTLFYASGEYKLSPVNQELLREFTFSHNLRDLDSVFILGYTDSTGNKKKNRKLAARRAITVAHFSEELLSSKVPFKTISNGEESEARNPRVNHRRVEFILYGKNYYQSEDRNVVRGTVNSKERGVCFTVYDSVMFNCYLSPYKRGASSYYKVRIPSYALPKVQLYSMSPASLKAKPLKWKTEKMGMLWWQQTVYTTLVKERDWNTYGLLVKNELDSLKSCLVCENDSTAPSFVYSLTPDVGIMQYCQVYHGLNKKKQVLIVPTEFVNVNLPYYFDKEQDFPITWQQKGGKLNSITYYAEIPERFLDTTVVVYSNHRHCVDSIQQYVPEFKSKIQERHACSNESNTYYGYCAIGFEGGFRKTAYPSLFFSYQYKPFNFSTILGFDYKLQVQSNVSVDAVFWSHAAFKSRMYLGRNAQDVHQYHPLFWIYGGMGAALMSNTRKKDWENIPNVHVGFAYKQPYMPVSLERIFIEGGVGYRFYTMGTKIEPYFRCGIRFKI